VHGSYVDAVEEDHTEGRRRRLSAAQLRDADEFDQYIMRLRSDSAEDASRSEGIVPQTTFWWIDGPLFIGRISIRHRLTEQLRAEGGHVGYDVRPSLRGKGHATAMLKAALPEIHRLGIDPALLTCNETNIASRRVIEKNGGVLQSRSDGNLRFLLATG
jgi:predicted acetyltransferase